MFKMNNKILLSVCLVVAGIIGVCGVLKYRSDQEIQKAEEAKARIYYEESKKDDTVPTSAITGTEAGTVTICPSIPATDSAQESNKAKIQSADNDLGKSNNKLNAGGDGEKTKVIDDKTTGANIGNTVDKKENPNSEKVQNDNNKQNDTKSSNGINQEALKKAEALAGREIEIDDYLVVDEIVTNKLSPNEAKYLYNSAKNNLIETTSLEELERIRSLIFSKLSSGEIDMIRSIGYKYGKGMDIIDPNKSLKELKENIDKQKK